MGDIVEIFEADDGESGWGVKPCLREFWPARALDSGVARTGGTGGIGAVRIELPLGDGILRYSGTLLFEEYHESWTESGTGLS